MIQTHQHHLSATIALVLVALVAVAALLFIAWLPSQQCSLLLQPGHTTKYSQAADVLQLKNKFGSLLKYTGDPSKPKTCLFVHGGAFTINKWLPFVKTLTKRYKTVYALEPRGFGPDHGGTSLGTYMIAIKIASERVEQVEQVKPDLAAAGMGASLARFANSALHIDAPRCLYFNMLDWPLLYRTYPWLEHCATLALSDWGKLPENYTYFIWRRDSDEEEPRD